MVKKFLALLLIGMLTFSSCGQSEEKVVESQEESIVTGNFDESGSYTPDEDKENTSSEDSFVAKLVIPEGYTLPRIGMTLEDMGICTAEAFILAAQNIDVSGYPLLAEQVENTNRCYKLEGYLFPATYEIYKSASPEQIIQKMLTHTESVLTPEIREKISASGYTTEQILTIASITEKEAFGKEYMAGISSVLHNRLKVGQRLECDVTITYVEGAIKPFIDGDIDRYNVYYNTYKCAALPAGPICNPGLDAIMAALEPDTSEYYFFFTDSDKNYYFSKTYEEHTEKLEKLTESGGELGNEIG